MRKNALAPGSSYKIMLFHLINEIVSRNMLESSYVYLKANCVAVRRTYYNICTLVHALYDPH